MLKVPNVLQGCLAHLGGTALASDEWYKTAETPALAESIGQEIDKLGKKFGIETEKLPWSAMPAHKPSCHSATHAILSPAQKCATNYMDATTVSNTMAQFRISQMMIPPTVPVARMGPMYGISVNFRC